MGDPAQHQAGRGAARRGGPGRRRVGPVQRADPVGAGPGGLAAGRGDVWVAQTATDAVARLDRDTGAVVQTVPVGAAPVAVAVHGEDVWVVDSGDGTVSRVSSTTNRVVQTVPVGNVPQAIAIGYGAVWVANQADATVTRIDQETGEVTKTVVVGDGPAGLAVGHGQVWVTSSKDNTVTATDGRTATANDQIPVGAGPTGITVAGSAVWVANSLDLTVTRIDPVRRRPAATVPVGNSPGSLVAVDGQVWVANEADGTPSRIDPNAGRVAQTVRIGATPAALTAVGGSLWVSTRPFAAASHRGGTLTVATLGLPDGLDPQRQDYDSGALAAMRMMYDGLLGLRNAGGPAGYDKVPDLAVTIPRPFDHGRSYRFVMRRNIHDSDGRNVTPPDIRRGIERAFTLRQIDLPTAYLTGIRGAAACQRHHGPCHLSQGITTDATTVTFHLSTADPEFPYKLAFGTAAAAVPPGTPALA